MKGKDLLLVLIGAFVSYLVFKGINKGKVEIIKKGDKGKEVLMLQKIVNKVEKKDKIDENGLYSKETKDKITKLFKGTKILIDEKQGAINKEFINSSSVLFNLKTK